MAQEEIIGTIATTLASIASIDPAEVTADKSLRTDLNIDSLAMVEFVVSLEDKFGLLIGDDQWAKFATIGDIATHLEKQGVTASS
jgi:acyl carrier protein